MNKNIKILSLISIISVMALVSISCNKKSTEYHMPSAGTYIDAKGLAVVVTIIDEKTFQVKGEIEGTKKNKSSFNITCTGDEGDLKNGYYFGKTISGTVDGKELTEAILSGDNLSSFAIVTYNNLNIKVHYSKKPATINDTSEQFITEYQK